MLCPSGTFTASVVNPGGALPAEEEDGNVEEDLQPQTYEFSSFFVLTFLFLTIGPWSPSTIMTFNGGEISIHSTVHVDRTYGGLR